MWDCLLCGCRAIAASLTGCPVCRKGRDMPKGTTGGSSNAREALEPGAAAPAEAAADADVQPGPEPVQAVSELPQPEPVTVPEVVAEVVPKPAKADPKPAPAKAEPDGM